MAELDFSHNVSEIPAAQRLPESYQNREKVEVTPFPNIQGAINNYAETSNWMSSLGAHVASVASNEVAKQIGGELGKNPKGDIGIPLTEFDKTMQDSYQTQAQATLGLQAQKLITDSNLEIARAPRVTPGLIAKSNENISLGLKNIFQHAPYEVKNNLENNYAEIQIKQTAELTRRMITEQKQDMKNNTALATQLNTQHAYSFGVNGNEKEALAVIESTRKLNESALAQNLITPSDAKENIDAAKKAYLNGHFVHQYEAFRAEGKGEEYLKNIADGKVIKTDDPNYMDVTNNLMNYINHQNSLRSQDQQLELTKFNVAVAQNPLSPDIASQIQELKNNVSPIEFERAHLSYITALKKSTKSQADASTAISSWSDPSGFSRLSADAVNNAFDLQVGNYVQQRQRDGNPITRDEAEVQIAASAGGQIPIFNKSINNKFSSPNPANIESASRQVELLEQLNAGNALGGLTKESRAMYAKYQAMRDSMDPVEAAQKAHEVVYNQDPAMIEINNQKWTNFLTKKPRGQTPDVFALKEVGYSPSQMRSPTVYGNDILEEYKTYYTMLGGDEVNAKKMLQQSVSQNYGETNINGMKEITKHPIEKVLNLPHDATGVVQQDIVEQLENEFNINKKYYTGYKDEQGKDIKPSVNEYWEVIPRNTSQDYLNHKEKVSNPNLIDSVNKPGSFNHINPEGNDLREFNEGSAIEVVRHMRGGKSQKYKVVVQMSPFAQHTGNEDHPIEGGWDVSVDSGSGIRLLAREAPYLGIVTYSPNVKRIKSNYSALQLMRRR